MKRIVLLYITFIGVICANAQNTLNVHTKSGEVVSYTFNDKPTVTYKVDGIHISTVNADVDYQYGDFEKITFSKSEDTTTDIIKAVYQSDDHIKIYDISGKLINTIDSNTFVISGLPRGVYIIKDSKTTYKISKK